MEIRLGQHQLGAFFQGRRHRLPGGDMERLGGDGFCQDDAGAFIPVPSNGRRDQPQIRLAPCHPPGRFPG